MTPPSTQERIWAVISHLSALTLGVGIVLPIVGWSEQREKSQYASFQCLQALGYQSLGFSIWLLTYLIVVILLLLVFAVISGRSGAESSLTVAWGTFFVIIILGLLGIYLLLPLVAAGVCAFGRDFRYPIMGKRLANYLGYKPMAGSKETILLKDEHENRWVTAMGHFSVIIVLWGLLAPAATLFLQGRHSTFLKFQSLQTMIYQGTVNIFYFGAVFLTLVGTVPLFALTSQESDPNGTSPLAISGMVFFLLFMLLAFLILLIVPLFHILGQWAGFRVLKGENYRYPLIGKLVEKRVAKHQYGVEGIAPLASVRPIDSKSEIS